MLQSLSLGTLNKCCGIKFVCLHSNLWGGKPELGYLPVVDRQWDAKQGASEPGDPSKTGLTAQT